MKNIALIIAGGIGDRANQKIPKQFIKIKEIPIIIYSLKAFQNHPDIDSIFVSCLSGWEDFLREYAKQHHINKLEMIVKGGKTGEESIINGVNQIHSKYNSNDDIVLIHDAIRPLVDQNIISDNIRVCREFGNATTVIPCTSVMLKTYDSMCSNNQVPRDQLRITQTPQSFFINELHEIHNKIKVEKHIPSVATCSLYVELGKKIYFSQGSERNIKITTAEDINMFSSLL